MKENSILIIDTTADKLIAIFGRRKKIIKAKASENLIKLIDSVLKSARADVICVVTGEGSWTGIRIGIVTVKALAEIWGSKILPVTTFDIGAYKGTRHYLKRLIKLSYGQNFVDINSLEPFYGKLCQAEEQLAANSVSARLGRK